MRTEEEAIVVLDKALIKLSENLGAMLGLNEAAFEETCKSLKFLAEHWRERKMVPRKVVAMILGVVDIMLNVNERYGSVEGAEIVDKAARIDTLITACFVD